jgi:hypothetical protein
MYRRFAAIPPPSETLSSLSGGFPKKPLYYMDARTLAQVVAALMLGPSILYFVCVTENRVQCAFQTLLNCGGGLPQWQFEIELFGAIVQCTHVVGQTGPPNGKAGFKYWGGC